MIAEIVLAADLRFRNPKCARVSEFFGVEKGEITSVRVVDGSDRPQCRNPDVVLWSIVGRPYVFVCSAQAKREDVETLEIMMIHEYLHTKGLNEHPNKGGKYTSHQITDKVKEYCGGSR